VLYKILILRYRTAFQVSGPSCVDNDTRQCDNGAIHTCTQKVLQVLDGTVVRIRCRRQRRPNLQASTDHTYPYGS
jgi:hypothetical protein